MAIAATNEPVLARDTDVQTVRALERWLSQVDADATRLVGPDGATIPLPESINRLVREIVHELAGGNAVTIVPVHTDLTTQQAADLLNVSRPFLVQLLESGTIPFHRLGSHRRVRLTDIMTYRRARSQVRRAALSEMARDAQDLGLYE